MIEPPWLLVHRLRAYGIRGIRGDVMTRLLADAFASPLMPEFVSSLPLAGVDGTMKNRSGAAGNAQPAHDALLDWVHRNG